MEWDREKAQLAVKKLKDLKLGPIGFNFIVYIHHALPNLDSFFAYMEKALEAHSLIPSSLM